MMSYEESLQHLYTRRRAHRDLSPLACFTKVAALIGNPHQAFPAVHIGGTNGKGSVATKVARALQYSGYSVGLYTSPHVVSFRERIQVNGQWVSKARVVALLDYLLGVLGEWGREVSFFELTTAIALLYFAQKEVDIAIVEVGIGGRLDATNILNPLVSAITSISYDHQDLLGSSLEAIAREKGGIIKPKTPVVLGPTAASHYSLSQRAKDLVAPCYPVLGPFFNYEEENSAIAAVILEQLPPSFALDKEGVARGLGETPPCRFEQVPESLVAAIYSLEGSLPSPLPPVVLDMGHNVGAFSFLFASLRERYGSTAFHTLFAMAQDKDLVACTRFIGANSASVHCVPLGIPRGAEPSRVAQLVGGEGAPCHYYLDIASGLSAALAAAKREGGGVVVCGSSMLMGAVRRWLGYGEDSDE